MRFGELKTGDVMELAGITAVVMAMDPVHPKNPNMCLVVWYIFGERRISFDMLAPGYELIPGSRVYSDGFVSWTRATTETRG